MTIRSILRDLITDNNELTALIPAERWKTASSITGDPDNVTERPFAVIRFTPSAIGMKGTGVERKPFDIWVHDVPGTYATIDAVIRLLKGTLDGVVHKTDSDGNEIMSADWVSDSGDQYDPGFRTIVKTSSYDLVGKGE